jgi:hypothetical protein
MRYTSWAGGDQPLDFIERMPYRRHRLLLVTRETPSWLAAFGTSFKSGSMNKLSILFNGVTYEGNALAIG